MTERVKYSICWPAQAPVKISEVEVDVGTDVNQLLEYLHTVRPFPKTGMCLYTEDGECVAGGEN